MGNALAAGQSLSTTLVVPHLSTAAVGKSRKIAASLKQGNCPTPNSICAGVYTEAKSSGKNFCHSKDMPLHVGMHPERPQQVRYIYDTIDSYMKSLDLFCESCNNANIVQSPG